MSYVRYVGSQQVWGAYGEDLWALQQFPKGYVGHAAEIGAYDGRSTSPTMLLEQHGWKVLCVEPLVEPRPALHANRVLVEECACDEGDDREADFHVCVSCPGAFSALRPGPYPHARYAPPANAEWRTERVRVTTVDRLLDKHRFPSLDVLAVDVEGTELAVLRGANLARWKPKVLIVETWEEPNASWDNPDPISELLTPLGYRLSHRLDVQNMYVRSG